MPGGRRGSGDRKEVRSEHFSVGLCVKGKRVVHVHEIKEGKSL